MSETKEDSNFFYAILLAGFVVFAMIVLYVAWHTFIAALSAPFITIALIVIIVYLWKHRDKS